MTKKNYIESILRQANISFTAVHCIQSKFYAIATNEGNRYVFVYSDAVTNGVVVKFKFLRPFDDITVPEGFRKYFSRTFAVSNRYDYRNEEVLVLSKKYEHNPW